MLVFLPGGPAAQFANLSFFLAALVSDVLLIRFFLVSAYVWLLVSAALGLPKWPHLAPTGGMAADTVVWACLCIFFHGHALVRMIYDERRIEFKTEDEEQLWRFFYRRSGMGRLEFKQILKHGRWDRVASGEPIIRGRQMHLRFFVLVEGLASLRLAYHGIEQPPRLQYSGSCFDLNLLNVFGIFIHFEKSQAHMLSVHAVTDCLLYSWSIDEMSQMATRMAPAVGAYWRYFALCQMGMYFGNASHAAQPLLCATGELEPEHVLQGARSRDFTDPLRSYESQAHSLPGFLRWLKRSFHPFPPPGLRHTQLPITGILARNRLIALKTAAAAAAIQEEGAVGGLDELDAREASAHGGRLAFEYLSKLQSLRRLDQTTVDEILQEAGPGSPRWAYTPRSGSGSPKCGAQFGRPHSSSKDGGDGRSPSLACPLHRSRSGWEGEEAAVPGAGGDASSTISQTLHRPDLSNGNGHAATSAAAGQHSSAEQPGPVRRSRSVHVLHALPPEAGTQACSGAASLKLWLSPHDIDSRGRSRRAQPADAAAASAGGASGTRRLADHCQGGVIGGGASCSSGEGSVGRVQAPAGVQADAAAGAGEYVQLTVRTCVAAPVAPGGGHHQQGAGPQAGEQQHGGEAFFFALRGQDAA